MSSSPNQTLDRIAAGGLLVGAVFGLAGTLVASPALQASLWAIDSVALVVATSLLALEYFRAGVDIVAGAIADCAKPPAPAESALDSVAVCIANSPQGPRWSSANPG